MIVLWILLGLLAAVFLLLLVPVHADVRYREKLELDVRYLFLRRTLLPAPEEPQAEKAGAPSKEKKPEAQKQKENPMLEKLARFKEAEGLSGLLHLAGDFLRLTGTSAAKIIRRLKIRDFDLYVLTSDEDAAAAAILYGQACAVVYPAAEALFTLAKCRRRRVSVDLDYAVKTPAVQLAADVSIRPLFALFYGLQYLIGLLPIYQRFSDPRSGAKRKG
ncbi:hypothetical protein [Hominenteromicrobium sp.]